MIDAGLMHQWKSPVFHDVHSLNFLAQTLPPPTQVLPCRISRAPVFAGIYDEAAGVAFSLLIACMVSNYSYFAAIF